MCVIIISTPIPLQFLATYTEHFAFRLPSVRERCPT